MKPHFSPLPLFCLLLMVCLLLIFGDLLTGHKALYYRDIFHNYEPQLNYMQQVLAKGELPLWHTEISGGTPLLPGLEPPLFYPGSWLFFIGLSFPVALSLNLMLHHFMAGLGMYWLGTRLSWHPLSATVAGVAFSLSGTLLSMNNLHPLLNTATWIPWLFGLAYLLLHQPHTKYAAAFGGVYGLQILSGHLEIVYFESLLLLAYGLLILALRKQEHTIPKTIPLSLLAIILGLAIGAIQFLPSILFIFVSARNTGLTLEVAESWSWHPILSSLFILPDIQINNFFMSSLHSIFGDPSFGYATLFISVYQGASLILLSAFSLAWLKKSPHKILTYFSLGGLLISFILAVGKYTPIYGLVYTLLPGISFFRYPSKWLIFSSFFFALLGGLGLESLIKRDKTENKASMHFRYVLTLGTVGLILSLFCLYIVSKLSMVSWLETYRKDLNKTTIHYLSQQIDVALQAQVIAGCIIIVLTSLCLAWWLKKKQLKILVLLSVLIGIDLVSSGITTLWKGERDVFNQAPNSMSLIQKIRKEDQSEAHLERLLVVPTTETKDKLAKNYKPDLKEKNLFFWKTLYGYEILMGDLPLRWNEHVPFSGWPAKTRSMEMLGDLHLNALKVNQTSARHRIEAVMAIRYLLLTSPTETERAFYDKNSRYRLRQELPDIKSSIWEYKDWQPRARFLTQAALVPSQDMALKTLIFPESGFDPIKQVVLEQSADLKEQLQTIPQQIPEQPSWTQPQITHESNQRLELAFETNQSGYLVLADQWTPGWRAWLNGTEVPILRANGFQRAIRVGPGQHQIRFEYALPGFATGVLLTGLGLLLLLVLWFWPYKPTASNDEAKIADAA